MNSRPILDRKRVVWRMHTELHTWADLLRSELENYNEVLDPKERKELHKLIISMRKFANVIC